MELKPTKISFSDTEVAFSHYSNRNLRKAYSVYQLIGNTFLTNIGTTLTKIALFMRFPIKPFVKPIVFNQFCGGENLKECMPTINLLEQRKVHVNLNYSVEIKHSEKDFEKTLCKTKGAIEFASRKRSISIMCCKVTSLGYMGILEKRQFGKELTKKETIAFDKMKARMEEICAHAYKHDVGIFWDAEESWIQDEIDILVDGFMAKYNTEKALIFNSFQLYRVDKLQYLEESIALAKQEGYILGAKLVRGAYIEKENEWAEENDEISVIHQTKELVDIDYNLGVKVCIENLNHVGVCIASHNEQSNLYATQLMEQYNIDPSHPNLTFSQLYGMGDFITFNLADNGYNANKYLPYGPVKEVIPYLMRRAQENSSVGGQMSRELSMIKKEMTRRGI
jgi:proline dehydrogenase